MARFGLRRQEEHVIFPQSRVTLEKSEDRIINLVKGTIRSRQLEPLAPAWSVVVSKQVSITPDALGDFVAQVTRKKRSSPDKKLFALRGQVKIKWVSGQRELGSGTPEGEVIIPAGSEITISQDGKASAVTRPDSASASKYVILSSPQYLLDADRRSFPNGSRGAYLSAQFRKHGQIPIDQVLIKVGKFDTARDSFSST